MAIHHPAGTQLTVNGRELWVEREGHGQPLVLLPGGPAASHLTFHPTFSSLADRFELIYVDLYGRGRAGRPASYEEITFEQDVEDLDGLRRALGFQTWNIYGFSYGGMVAQAYALEHPRAVRKLVLANTVHSAEMWQRNHENINRELANQYPEIWDQILALRAQGVPSLTPEVQALYRVHSALVRFYNPANATRLLSEPGSRNEELYRAFAGEDIEFMVGGQVALLPDFRPRLKELAMPTLILAGRFDRALYPAMQMDFRRFAPQARFVMLEHSGSFGHIEEPETVLDLLRRFLSPES
jgi:proline iminopeptidase